LFDVIFTICAGYNAAGEAIDLLFSHYATESHLLGTLEVILVGEVTWNEVSLVNQSKTVSEVVKTDLTFVIVLLCEALEAVFNIAQSNAFDVSLKIVYTFESNHW
jgi:hypothetical protein